MFKPPSVCNSYMYADAGSCFEMMITTKVNHWLCLTRIGHYFDKLRYICVIRNHVNMGEDLYILTMPYDDSNVYILIAHQGNST